MGVSICLDVVKEWVSTVEKILTASKSASWQLRNLGQDRDFLILSQHQCPDQKVSIKIEKFIKIWKFRHFSTVYLNLDWEVRGFLYFLVEISQSVETFHHFQTQKVSTMSTFLDCVTTNLNASCKILTIATRLDNLNKNLDASKSQLKSLNFVTLKKLVSTLRTFQLSRPPGLLTTVRITEKR